MKKMIRTIKEMIAVMAFAGLMFVPLFTAPVLALPAVGCIDSGDCSGGETCSCMSGSACTQGGDCTAVGVPEMSDYLAMAFLVVAGTMIYYIRRRELATA